VRLVTSWPKTRTTLCLAITGFMTRAWDVLIALQKVCTTPGRREPRLRSDGPLRAHDLGQRR
jgi:hypothetical protein